MNFNKYLAALFPLNMMNFNNISREIKFKELKIKKIQISLINQNFKKSLKNKKIFKLM